MPRGRPKASWLRQVESYLRDTGMAGLATAWAMADAAVSEHSRSCRHWLSICLKGTLGPHLWSSDPIIRRCEIFCRIWQFTQKRQRVHTALGGRPC